VEGIRTQFVRDRLRETSWENREYIADLKALEEWYGSWDRPRGIAAGMWHSSMTDRYRFEAECIKKEIREGIYTSPEEFRRLIDEWKEEQKRKEAEQRLKEAEEARQRLERERQEREWLEEERRKWLEAGGKP
jgi:hypothetical protein